MCRGDFGVNQSLMYKTKKARVQLTAKPRLFIHFYKPYGAIVIHCVTVAEQPVLGSVSVTVT